MVCKKCGYKNGFVDSTECENCSRSLYGDDPAIFLISDIQQEIVELLPRSDVGNIGKLKLCNVYILLDEAKRYCTRSSDFSADELDF